MDKTQESIIVTFVTCIALAILDIDILTYALLTHLVYRYLRNTDTINTIKAYFNLNKGNGRRGGYM